MPSKAPIDHRIELEMDLVNSVGEMDDEGRSVRATHQPVYEPDRETEANQVNETGLECHVPASQMP